MNYPTQQQAHGVLEQHVQDQYQRYHARMVATAMAGYAELYNEDPDLWYATGLLHDVDFEEFPDKHPAVALGWFREWGYPEELIHAVEAHAYGYNGFTTLPQTKLAAALLACDEMSGIFYAYLKINPQPFGQMKPSSIRKRFNEKNFAAKIDRSIILRGCEALGVGLDEHVDNLIRFLGELDV